MKILVVLPRFPYPLEKGDKLRAFYQIRELSKHNEVYLFCVSHTKVPPESIEKLTPYCRDIKVVHSPRLVNYKNVLRNYLYTKSLQIGYWDSLKARRRILKSSIGVTRTKPLPKKRARFLLLMLVSRAYTGADTEPAQL